MYLFIYLFFGSGLWSSFGLCFKVPRVFRVAQESKADFKTLQTRYFIYLMVLFYHSLYNFFSRQQELTFSIIYFFLYEGIRFFYRLISSFFLCVFNDKIMKSKRK